MTQVIFTHQGTIDKFIGDSIMILFGAPTVISQQEQVMRARACALAMHAALQQLNQRWQAESIEPFAMRIGIHSGAAIVGTFGNEMRSEYTAIGSTVNLASRIEHCAEPGSVYISAAVRDLMDDELWTFAGNFELKGIGSTPLFKLLEIDPKLRAA